MNKINLKMPPHDFKNPTIKIDGKTINFKKQSNGEYAATYETEKDSVELTVTKLHEASGKLWFLWAFFFFVIGCFGIFDPRYDYRCRAIDFKLKLDLKEQTNLKLHFIKFSEGGRAIDCVRDCPAEEITNYYYTDMQAKKKLKIFKIIKPFIWLAIIALVIFLIVKGIMAFLGF